jgi:Tfp pilus assembly protein PilF
LNLRTKALYSIFFILSFLFFEAAYAQKTNTDSIAAARKQYYDSIKTARQQTTDSIKAVRQHASDSMAKIRKYKESKRYTDSVAKVRNAKTDSIQAVRKHFTDSLQATRKQRTDSLNAIRKYRESKRYTDSVAKARKTKTEAIQAARQQILDSTTAARKKITDSTIAARKAVTDSIRTIQKARTDSMAKIRKYRESKRYQDSVAIVRKERLDSIKLVRKDFNDSVAADRKQKSDSMMAVRKAFTDSTTAARTKYSDSLKEFRKARTDSLAKIKEKRAKDQKARAKTKAEKQQLAFEMKLNKKRQAWSNEKMLKKKWGVSRQIVQNTFTRYNYYFNTDKKMDEAIDNMLRAQNENYDSLLALFPYDPDRDSSLLASDMDSIIQKASIGIQLHDPRTKWGDDLYLLMGQAYYYKADYDNASTTFRYALSLRDKKKKKSSGSGYSQQSKSKDGKKTTSIVQADNKSMLDFMKHRSVHNETLLWLARTYTEWHQDGNAESVLDILENEPDFPKSLQGRLALERAYLNMSQGDYTAAKSNLAVVADDNQLPDWLRIRAAYISGQLHQERGEHAEAAKYFAKVVDLNPKIDMDFYARKNLAYSQMYAGVDQNKALASLKRVLKDGKYTPYYEQVYFVMGQLAAQSGKNEEAIGYLQSGLQSPKTTKKQKAVSFATLGDVYYNMRSYENAKNYYDSAALVASAAPNDSAVIIAVRRSKVLDDVTRPSRIIYLQDSLLDLAAMNSKDQRSVVRRYIRALETARADSIFRAENGGMTTPSDGNTSGAQTSGSWYFGNPVLVQQGINEFKRKWGTRTNTDNWRRSAAIASSGTRTNTPDNQPTDANPGDVDEDAVQYDENGIPTEESLLAQIPNSQIRKEDALNRIRRAYVDLAGAYIKQLEDYPQASRTLDTFDKRFPANEHMAEVLYLRYLVAMRQSNMTEARLHADKLLRDYGNTSWAALVRPTEDGSGLSSSTTTDQKVDEYYDRTYDLLIQRQFTQTLQMARDGQKMYSKETPYVKRFRIIEAFSLAGTADYSAADTIARTFIKQNPGDTLIPWAEAVLSYSKANRPDVIVPPPPPKPSAADTSKATTKTSAADDVVDVAPVDKVTAAPLPSSLPSEAPPPAQYMYTPKDPHLAMIYLPSTDQRGNALKAAITDFNTFKFSSLNLKLEMTKLTDTKTLIINRTFETALQAKIYMNMLKNTPEIFKQYSADEYEVIIISEQNQLKLMADKDMEAYMKFYRAKYK